MVLREPRTPLISVVIPTFNRAALLRASLESLTRQTLPLEDYEVVVVNDGSSDATEAVCKEFASRVRFRYLHIKNSGISAAKNLGIFVAAAPLLLFFDDDDIATPTLLEEHVRTHREHATESVAVLGYTTWAPSLTVTPVMEYITNIGQQLFAYKNLKQGQRLDYTYFWGGRSSCKRSLLIRHGIFNQTFRAIIEDIELGYRLSLLGLRVIYNPCAVQYMNRPVSYEAFFRRCEKQGNALFHFSCLHSDPTVERYCRVHEAKKSWDAWKNNIGMGFYRVREIEALLECESEPTGAESLRSELHKLYGWTFSAAKARGIVRAEEHAGRGPGAAEAGEEPAPVVRPVVVYQMGKVGSKSVEESLRAHNLPVPICHSHLLNDLDRVEKHIRLSRANPGQTLVEVNHGRHLRKTLLGTSYIQCQVISLVRDPVARNISAFFENISEFIPDCYGKVAAGELEMEAIVSTFLDRYDHDTPLRWFDFQMKPVFGIDVFASEFPKERGYAVYHGPNATLLLIKLEQLDRCASAAVWDFLGIEQFLLRTANAAEGKDYKRIYRSFIDTITLPPEYLDRMYDSKLVQHFYTGDEIRGFRERWDRRQGRVATPASVPTGRTSGTG